jgi:hypothetical protein
MLTLRNIGHLVLFTCLLGCSSAMPANSTGTGTAGASPATSDDAPLPPQLKGYELYAWEADGELWFTLVTGTNRLKSRDELQGPPTETRADDWVVVRGRGLEALEAVLRRVPATTSVTLSTHGELPALSADTRARIESLLAR